VGSAKRQFLLLARGSRPRRDGGSEQLCHPILVYPLVPGDGANHSVKRAQEERVMVWNRYPVMGRSVGLEHDVAASLMDDPIVEVAD